MHKKNIGKGLAIAILAVFNAGIALGLILPLVGPWPSSCSPLTVTRVQLANAGIACDVYLAEFGEPPASLDDLVHNRENIVLMEWGKSGPNDAWGNPIRFKPYDASLGYGSVLSYGCDGRPGGKGEDADIEVRFGARKR